MYLVLVVNLHETLDIVHSNVLKSLSHLFNFTIHILSMSTMLNESREGL